MLPLGPYWKHRFSTPYVLDFQDEWIGDYYRDRPQVRPPGGRFKYRMTRLLARFQEKSVVKHAAQIVSVSSAYNRHLLDRYPHLMPSRLQVLPFGGGQADFHHLDRSLVRQSFFEPNDGALHWVYVGRGGPDMHHSLGAFFPLYGTRSMPAISPHACKSI